MKTVAIGGLGAIGMRVARAIDAGIDGLRLSAVSARDVAAAEKRISAFRDPPPVLPLAELAAHADMVVECAPAAFFDEIAVPAIEAGCIFIPCSCGRLIERGALIERARETGARIIVPTGALVGFDAVRAAAEGQINEVRMVTRKPPKGIHGAPYIEDNNIDLSDLSEPLKVFEGTVREAAAGFPANLNVAAALSMAALGPDKTIIELWADPTKTRNEHTIIVDSDASYFEIKIAGIPSPDNPATGLLTPLSVIATLRGLVATFRVGS
ncbi:MAG: aspartate dehydrogenase [Proteobacteria bacterium]|nr:aspartate dehydrogenase [Pseudomonadota bacterium]